jgi:hypothetical protein
MVVRKKPKSTEYIDNADDESIYTTKEYMLNRAKVAKNKARIKSKPLKKRGGKYTNRKEIDEAMKHQGGDGISL